MRPPEFREMSQSVVVTFRVKVGETVRRTAQVTDQVTIHGAIHVTMHVSRLLRTARKPRTRGELQVAVKLKNRAHFLKSYLVPLLAAGLLEMTIPDKPKSPLQRYRTTKAGLHALKERRR
jgi:ATP-dependent DNA helicase RecG